MSEHAVFSDEMREIVESFVVETQEIFDELNDDLLRLENADEPSLLIDKVFRAVHTVKGTSSFLSLDQLNTLAHHFEEVLNRLRKGDIVFRPEIMDVLFASFDQMSALYQQVLDRHITPLHIDDLLDDLRLLGSSDIRADGPLTDMLLSEQPGRTAWPPPADDGPAPRPNRHRGSVRVDIDRLDDLIALAGELSTSRTALTRIIENMERTSGPLPHLRDLREKTHRIGELAGEIRSVILTTRMVRIDRVFTRFQRVARDLGRSLGKQVRIECRGSDVQIDTLLADEIAEALLHLVRNAVDHGLECRDVRRASGKPDEGCIVLEARHRDQYVEIAVEDDGRGLNPTAILSKAIALGQLAKAAAPTLAPSEIFDLIWEPGFSTTDVVNRVSGRGIGLDVVRNMVSRLDGSTSVHSVPGRGTCFVLRLPLTASMVRSLLVELCGTTYALPQSCVADVFRLAPGESLADAIDFEGESLPLLRISDIQDVSTQEQEGGLAAVLRHDGGSCALVLEGLHGEEEIVHTLSARGVSENAIISGTTVLCDGRVVPVLDGAGIVRRARRGRRTHV